MHQNPEMILMKQNRPKKEFAKNNNPRTHPSGTWYLAPRT